MTATTANNLAAQSHVTPGWFERTFSSGWKLALALLLITLLVRVSVMGDPGYHPDEEFYVLVAQRLRAGAFSAGEA